LEKIITLLKPKFFLPIHGQFSMLVHHARLAERTGIAEKNIAVAENGNVVSLTKTSIAIEKRTVPASYVMVDGLGVGDVGEIVLRDRQNLAQDGMFVIIVVVDRKSGRVKGSPDIISRGFIYLRESKDLLSQVRRRDIETVKQSTAREGAVNWVHVKDNVRTVVTEFLFTKTQRNPMVLPVIIEV
ncbi:ribonuclease J, partial [Patescibacteria group bacterium]|nr:ribonuclease J [Patescibacteria group bacterium]